MEKAIIIPTETSFEQIVDLVANGKSVNTRKAYRLALREFLEWFSQDAPVERQRDGFTRHTVMSYLDFMATRGVSSATVNLALAAIRALAMELRYAGVIDTETYQGIKDVKNIPHRGSRTHTWLTQAQAKRLIEAPDTETLKGKQQAAVLALLLGCALRREEASNLTCEQIQIQGDQWMIANLVGKGNKTRTVPIPAWAIDIIHTWQNAADVHSGKLLRAVNKADKLAGPMQTRGGHTTDGGVSPQAIYALIKKMAKKADLPPIAPHSLRRTWAKVAWQQDAPLDQIRLILGHASLTTTEKYLGLNDVDLQTPVHVTYNGNGDPKGEV